MTGWELTNANGSSEVKSMNGMVMANLENNSEVQSVAMYWVAPSAYLGNRVSDARNSRVFSYQLVLHKWLLLL